MEIIDARTRSPHDAEGGSGAECRQPATVAPVAAPGMVGRLIWRGSARGHATTLTERRIVRQSPIRRQEYLVNHVVRVVPEGGPYRPGVRVHLVGRRRPAWLPCRSGEEAAALARAIRDVAARW